MLLSLLLILSIVLVVGLILSPNSTKKSKRGKGGEDKGQKKGKFSEAKKQNLLLNLGKKSREEGQEVRLTKLYLFDFGDKKIEKFSEILMKDNFEVFNSYIENWMEKANKEDLFCFKSQNSEFVKEIVAYFNKTIGRNIVGIQSADSVRALKLNFELSDVRKKNIFFKFLKRGLTCWDILINTKLIY